MTLQKWLVVSVLFCHFSHPFELFSIFTFFRIMAFLYTKRKITITLIINWINRSIAQLPIITHVVGIIWCGFKATFHIKVNLDIPCILDYYSISYMHPVMIVKLNIRYHLQLMIIIQMSVVQMHIQQYWKVELLKHLPQPKSMFFVISANSCLRYSPRFATTSPFIIYMSMNIT